MSETAWISRIDFCKSLAHTHLVVKNWVSIVLVGIFAAIGSGALQYAHLLEHMHAGAPAGNQRHSPIHDREHHDEEHCAICSVLQMPTLSQRYVPILISLGLLVAFVTELVTLTAGYRLPASIDCRGPPAVA